MTEMKGAVFISGPMTGYPGWNYRAFNEAAHILRQSGYTVLNPAENHEGRTTLAREVYLRESIAQVTKADCLAMLPGWELSEGAKIELAVADAIRIPAYDFIRDRGDIFVTPINRSVLGESAANSSVEPITTWAEAETDLLKAAQHIVHGDRQRTYGHPAIHHARTAKLYSAFLGVDITASDVALLFVLDKLSRTRGQSKPDTIVDIAGYAQVHAMVKAAEERGEA